MQASGSRRVAGSSRPWPSLKSPQSNLTFIGTLKGQLTWHPTFNKAGPELACVCLAGEAAAVAASRIIDVATAAAAAAAAAASR